MDPLNSVSALTKAGRFLEALEALDQCKTSRRQAANIRRLEILERLGRHDECRLLANRLLDSRQLTDAQGALCHYVAGSILLEQGDTKFATAHLQRSIALARKGEDSELLCNVQLKFLGLVADLSGPDAAAPILSELRRNAILAGSPYTTAAVHIFVAQTEASRGLFRSAHRHLRIADGLAATFPNPWLEAHSENIKLAICLLLSDIDGGQKHAVRGRQLADACGAATIRRAIAANQALLYLLAGDFSAAAESITRALSILASAGERRNGCLDTLARIYLAEGRLGDCESALNQIEESIRLATDQGMYANRHAVFTRCQLLSRRGRFEDALVQADSVERLAIQMGDRLLLESIRLTRAEILLLMGRQVDATAALEKVSGQFRDFSPELYVQFERTVACSMLAEGAGTTARLHYERAKRVCHSIKNAPVAAELERRWSETITSATQEIESGEGEGQARNDVIQSVAAMLAHAGRGEFIAHELATLLARVCDQCFVEVRASSTIEGPRIVYSCGHRHLGGRETRTQKTFIVQSDPSNRIELTVEVVPDVAAVSTLSAVTTLISALQDLERARVDREERATIWPADEVPLDGDHSVITGHMHETMTLAQKVARTTVSVLITGESGTGKEIVARAIHAASARAQKPFVPFSCAAIPRDLVESQLFGHRRGAFTGADRDYLGVIRAARDGTLFLDEIGDLSLDLQPKLLRFLESGEIAPLGDSGTHHVNVRIVAATNVNLEEAVRDGRFREDLFYRLNVVRLTLRPLRERRDEIPGLVNAFVMRAAKEFHKGRLEVAEETMERLLLYRWPGNVRQLQNELRRIVALAEPDSTLGPELISRDILDAMPIFRSDASRRELAVRLTDKLTPTLLRVECEMIKCALRDNQGKVDAVAKALGISRKGLYLKRQRLGL